MAQEYMPLSDEPDEPQRAKLDEHKTATIVRIEEYLYRNNRRALLKDMGRKAMDLHYSNRFLGLTTMNVTDHQNGDITVLYAGFREDGPDDMYGMAHSGESKNTETRNLLAARYEAESESITATYVHPRNSRYIESDIRASLRTGTHEQRKAEAEAELDNAKREHKEALERHQAALHELEQSHIALEAALSRLQAAEIELLASSRQLFGEAEVTQGLEPDVLVAAAD